MRMRVTAISCLVVLVALLKSAPDQLRDVTAIGVSVAAIVVVVGILVHDQIRTRRARSGPSDWEADWDELKRDIDARERRRGT
jgi:hypothetical protein